MADPKKTTDNLINEMYDAQIAGQKAKMEADYQAQLSDLQATQQQTAQKTQENLNRTAVESQKARLNFDETQNAYGISSGAMVQARLAQDNALAQNLTTLRQTQQQADAEFERKRLTMGQQYQAAIIEAQANNDFQRANALLAEAKQKESELRTDRQNAAALVAGAGDYTLYQQLYGLSASQVAQLKAQWAKEQARKDKSSSSYSTVPTGPPAPGSQSFDPAVVDLVDALFPPGETYRAGNAAVYEQLLRDAGLDESKIREALDYFRTRTGNSGDSGSSGNGKTYENGKYSEADLENWAYSYWKQYQGKKADGFAAYLSGLGVKDANAIKYAMAVLDALINSN